MQGQSIGGSKLSWYNGQGRWYQNGESCKSGRGAAKLEPILILAGKFVIWSAVVWLFRYPTKTAILVGLGLTQIGEFSYVLVRVARDSHLVGDDVYNAMLAASVITIVVNGLLTRATIKPAAQTRPA